MGIKKLIALTLALLLLALSFASCAENGQENSKGESKAESSEQPSADISKEETQKLRPSDIEDYSAYVTLGKYIGVEIEETVLTDETVEKELKSLMDSLKEYKDVGTERAAKLGDVTILDYKGYREDTGEAFEGGEAEDASLDLGSGAFIPGFEEAIVGHSAGESFDIYVTFPEEYRDKELAGQPVRFAITLKTVKEAVYPSVTDEVAKKLNFETADALKAQARTNAENAVYLDNLQKAWNTAVSNATINSYPEELYDYNVKSFVDYYLGYYQYMASMYGMALADFVGMSEEEFRADLEKEGRKYTESYLSEEMVMFAIADAEFGRELTVSELQEKIEEYAKKDGITTDEFKAKYDIQDIKNNALWDKVLVYVYEKAVKASANDGLSADESADLAE